MRGYVVGGGWVGCPAGSSPWQRAIMIEAAKKKKKRADFWKKYAEKHPKKEL